MKALKKKRNKKHAASLSKTHKDARKLVGFNFDELDDFFECKLTPNECNSGTRDLSYSAGETDCPYDAVWSTYTVDGYFVREYKCKCQDGSGNFYIYDLNDGICESCDDNSDESQPCLEYCRLGSDGCDGDTTGKTSLTYPHETDCINGALWEPSISGVLDSGYYYCDDDDDSNFKDYAGTVEQCPYGAVEEIDEFGRSSSPPYIMCKCYNYDLEDFGDAYIEDFGNTDVYYPSVYDTTSFKDGSIDCFDFSDECVPGAPDCSFTTPLRPICDGRLCTAEQLIQEYQFISNLCS